MEKRVAHQRGNVDKFIAYCESVVNMPQPNITKGYLEAKTKIISEFWAKLDKENDEILREIEEEEMVSKYFTQREFEKAFTAYDKVTVKIQSKLEKFEGPGPQLGPITFPENVTVRSSEGDTKLKLKPIDVPKFFGDYKKWISFRNMFDSMVHKNEKFSGLEKMHYLKTCLGGEAEDILSQFDITEEAYPEAYKVITSRYHNEVILVDTHIMDLLSQPKLMSESSDAIKGLLDGTERNLRALEWLKIDVSTWDPILLLLLVQKLDRATRRLWEQMLKPKVRPSMKEFLEFLDTRFHALGCQQVFNFSIESTDNYQPRYKKFKKSSGNEHSFNPEEPFPPRVHQNFHNSSQPKQRNCPFNCGEAHQASDCENFQKSNLDQRWSWVNGNKLCKNCLKGHLGKCSLRPGCQKCGKYHHTLLHVESSKNPTVAASTGNSHAGRQGNNTEIRNHHTNVQQELNQLQQRNEIESVDRVVWDEPIMLATAIVLIRSLRDNLFYPFRALLDQASTASYVCENVVQFLGLQKQPVIASTSGLGGVTTGNIKSIVEFELGSKRNHSFSMLTQAPVTKKITSPLPSTILRKAEWDHIKDLQLADPEFNVPAKIDLLLGAPVYGYLLLPGLIKSSPMYPVAQNTEFGWILSGATRPQDPVQHKITNFHLKLELEDQLKKFFDQEEVSKERILTQEEVQCEKIFEETVQRRDDGRFVVALPFKGNPKSLGASKGQAFSRLMKLESRFKANQELQEEYVKILKEYEELEHTSVIGELDKSTESTSYYLPHHAVFKPESTTTKTRVVFDASARTTSGLSLNDLLMTGPTLQQDLMSILLRWRTHRISIMADIAKMYRQVVVRKEDRKYQRFLFREKIRDPILEYEHNMVTFGITAATYLAVKALQYLAKIEKDNYKEAAEVVIRDFYMDDCMSGADTVQQAIRLCKDLKELLAKAQFPLRKFVSNSAEVLESLPEADRELKLPLEINLDSNIKTLGIRYEPTTDVFRFKVNLEKAKIPPTKRSMLSETASLFDPLGWLAPVIVRAKIMFQDLWKEGLDWKQELPKNIASVWTEFRNELHQLENIQINRWNHFGAGVKKIEIHGFSDASEKAYAAVIYSRVVNQNDEIHITMLTSKTRVAPIKQITLPRLELCGAVLLTNLIENVQKALGTNNENVHAWTDSTIVLGWLRTDPAKLKTFVANRVVETHNVLNINQWHHIEGTKNPADCASRGISPGELKNHKLWWEGAECLKEHRESWEQNLQLPPVTLELKKKVVSTFVITPHNDFEDLFTRYSSFRRLIRVTAICWKFVENIQATREVRIATLCLTFVNKLLEKRKGMQLTVTAEDLRRAELRLIRLHQGKEFSRELHHLMKKENINPKSKLLPLNPFVDSNNCLRVGGRLENANIDYDRKHPLIISAGGLAKLIIADMHEETLHGGTRLTMNMVREKYWIINLRRQVKQCVLNCVKCCRYNQRMGEQIMADLPPNRVTESMIFAETGLDYAGPFNIKASNVRSPPIRIKPTVVNGEVIKSIPKIPVYEGYIALFICFATKAVHLEVVSDQTTEAFLAAFDRFISRRGTPERCHSDNSKTFIGAKNVLAVESEQSMLDYNQVINHAADKGINWSFIPPRAPHFGGIWESNIKSMKHHLKRVIGDITLTYEELSTVLTKVEACLNSRPMCQLNDDPNDLSVLTPGHFLIGRPLKARPKGIMGAKGVGVKERWNVVQRIYRDFWDAWSKEYLNQLQHRPKWQGQKKNFKEGDVVLLKEDNIAPTRWPLARVVKVHSSLDKNVRSLNCVRYPWTEMNR
ncbi:uncharacterized protein LOC119084808 isoform X2 [Bradysia coprophila]|uniref:uncharacterized protein LOC119084808 isoform X2 n=1 Tax=Bradysia coprophila TaxID=38358 RepID=UPI00187DCDD0|nr:uncharacterized protein LOC119084808 isoform X2 [Bradysia coprophila]